MSQESYVIYGSEYSPFSMKVRSYFRYKNISHEWRPRTFDNMAEFQALAKLPLVPLVHRLSDGEVLQDSTPIIEKLEDRHGGPLVTPSNAAAGFISALIEEYADEWVNKPMFHYRWWREVDQIAVSEGLAKNLKPKGSGEEQANLSVQLRERMVPRLSFVGSSAQNKETIEASFITLLKSLEPIFQKRTYLFGGKPSLADFGLFGQVYCCRQQPTTLAILEEFPAVQAWLDFMLDPKVVGDWDAWDDVNADLKLLLEIQIGGLYLPWANANSKALRAEESTFNVTLMGREFTQDTIKYAGRSLAELKQKFSAIKGNEVLEQYLLDTGCLQGLAAEEW